MFEAFSNIASAFGLSSAAGLNAYLPLLVVALTARYTDKIALNEPWNILTNGWVIGALVVLLIIEMLVDKIPAVDTLNDGIQTIGRPLAGAVLFAGTSGVIGEMNPALALIAGLLLAGGVHTAKSVTRPAVTTLTGGAGNWFVSIVEDVVSFFTAIFAIILPVLMAVLLAFAFILLAWVLNKRRRGKAISA
ncbi:MAG TPA: DUF4126 domain-containing protein [Chloroflexi bacterium]|nr:DUF4126 domain-containing protein [Chloroflexota bacterium]